MKSLKPARNAFFFSSGSQKNLVWSFQWNCCEKGKRELYMLEKLLESETGAGFCTPKVGINIKQYHNRTHIICPHIHPGDTKSLPEFSTTHFLKPDTKPKDLQMSRPFNWFKQSPLFFWFFFFFGATKNLHKSGKICNKTGEWKGYQSEEWTSPKTWWFDDDEHCSSETVSFALRS